MAEDSVFDSGLSGIIGETEGSRKSAAWEENLLGSLSDGELTELMSEPAGGLLRVASSGPGEGGEQDGGGKNTAQGAHGWGVSSLEIEKNGTS
jgi:hypothetical protein